MDGKFVIVLVNDDDNTVEAVCAGDNFGGFFTEIEAVGIGSELADNSPGRSVVILPLVSFESVLDGQPA